MTSSVPESLTPVKKMLVNHVGPMRTAGAALADAAELLQKVYLLSTFSTVRQ